MVSNNGLLGGIICVVALYITQESLHRVLKRYESMLLRLDKINDNLSEQFPRITSDSPKNPSAEFKQMKLEKYPNCSDNYDFIVIVQSRMSHFSQRMVIRNTWGRPTNDPYDGPRNSKWKVFFMVVRSKHSQSSLLLRKEVEEFQDIIIGNTYENFYTLHLKLYLAFEWSLMQCKYKYLVKADDDVFVNIKLLRLFLDERDTPKENLYAGTVQFKARVMRDGRYGVPLEEYQKNVYPRYCSGGGFILSADVVRKMHKNFNKVPSIRIDDAYLGEVALYSGVDAMHDERFDMYVKPTCDTKDPTQCNCRYQKHLIIHHPVKSDICMEEIYDGYVKYIDEDGYGDYKSLKMAGAH